MSRRWISSAELRARQAESRQAERDADAEGACADLALELLGDAAQDEAAIEAAPAFCVGHGPDYQIYVAQRPLNCFHCGMGIAKGERFTSRTKHGAELAEKAACWRHVLRRSA